MHPTILLTFGVRLALLPAMVVDIQAGPRQWSVFRLGQEKDPRIDIPYTYLIAWYVMHYPSLMTTLTPDIGSTPFVQRLERSKWRVQLLPQARKFVDRWVNYTVRPFFVEIPGGSFDIEYADIRGSKGYTVMPPIVFDWFMNIRMGYLVFWSRDRCIIVPYMPCRFPR